MMIIQDAMPYDEPASQPTSQPCHPNKPVVKAGKQKGKNRHPCRPFPCPFPWQNTEEKNRDQTAQDWFFITMTSKIRMSKDVTSGLGELLFVYFFALLLPLTLFPHKTVFRGSVAV